MSGSLSLDTVLTIIALTGVFQVAVFAIMALGVPILVMARHMACFFEHNRMCEVVGLFVLLLVDIVRTSRVGHPVLLSCEIDLKSRAIFYFVPFTAMLADVVQERCRRKTKAQVAARSASHLAAAR